MNKAFILVGLLIGGSATPAYAAYTPPPNCVSWNDGCNSCSRSNNGSMCTMMACMEEHAGYCTAYDTTSAPSETTRPGSASGGASIDVGIGEPPQPTPAVSAHVTATSSTTDATTTDQEHPKGFFASIFLSIKDFFKNLF